MECGCNIDGLKCLLAAINREMDNIGIRYFLGCHGMVELDDHPGVEKPAWGHKWLQGVPQHQSHRVYELWIFRKGRKIIMNLAMQVPSTAIRISDNRAAVEDGSLDDRSRGQIKREISSRALVRW